MDADVLRDELRDANVNHAILYSLFFTWTAGKRGCCTLKTYAPESVE